ncbi:MAG: UDP-4-amino-4,6-dideoxy-N-acetyl-beta-L-altrosamine transaminase [Patescibacteria group bacterium]|jgi:UDP-4-amino-4,6-dideoxy-N-acetyl-beta-L-altrosamine transaminase
MISYGSQNIDQADINEVIKVLRSANLTQGPKVKEFEIKLAKYSGVKYAVAVSNGTAALFLAYLAAGLKPGDEIITTPNSFVATTNMMLALGIKPVFVDISLATYNMDERNIIKALTKKTKAIVPVDFGGQAADLKTINLLAKKHGLLIIEDASHALGAKHYGKKIGQWADLTIFSFHPVKSITTGEGGAILTNNKNLYQKLLLLRSHGIHKNQQGRNVMTELGYNFRLTDLQSALGSSQLKKVDSFIKKRREVVKWYQAELKNLSQIILPQEKPENYSSWHLYVIRTKKISDRDMLGNFLTNKGIGINYHYPAIYKQPYYQKIGFKKTNLLNEEIYQSSCLTLPCHTLLTQKDIKYIAGEIKKFYHSKK